MRNAVWLPTAPAGHNGTDLCSRSSTHTRWWCGEVCVVSCVVWRLLLPLLPHSQDPRSLEQLTGLAALHEQAAAHWAGSSEEEEEEEEGLGAGQAAASGARSGEGADNAGGAGHMHSTAASSAAAGGTAAAAGAAISGASSLGHAASVMGGMDDDDWTAL